MAFDWFKIYGEDIVHENKPSYNWIAITKRPVRR